MQIIFQKKIDHDYKTTETACQTSIIVSVNKSSQRTGTPTEVCFLNADF